MPVKEALDRVRVPVGDLGPGDTRLVPIAQPGGNARSAIVVNHEGELRVYANLCPHVTYSLDIGDGEVKDPTGAFLMCSAHGAMFLPESGECFMGPVVGRRLMALPFERDGDELVITVTPQPPEWPAG